MRREASFLPFFICAVLIINGKIVEKHDFCKRLFLYRDISFIISINNYNFASLKNNTYINNNGIYFTKRIRQIDGGTA
jgi:hypothetical protein